MNKALILFVLLIAGIRARSQDVVHGAVSGKISDTLSKQNLSSASVSVISTSDSTNHAFAITDKLGQFTVTNLNAGAYKLTISYQGYENIVRRFSIDASNSLVNLGTLFLDKESQDLAPVIVTGSSISVKKDTVEFAAGMYATKPNAVAEDLLKKLPGVQVDASGNITAQGETVTRVLVNGKRFFSDDPKLATRNLPPDVIDKIQVFDDLDDQSKLSGFDNGNRVKTINITTRKDKRQGYFGRTVAGVGTNEDYDESINMHRFDNDRQISLLGQGNDINKQNFTVQDILGNAGGRRGGGGPAAATNQSSPGITTVWAGGANYRDAWSPKTDVYGSYFYNFQHIASIGSSITVKNLSADGDSSYTTNQSQSAYQRTTNQRVYLNLEQRFDSSNQLVFRPNFTYQDTKPNANSNTQTVDQNGGLINSTSGFTSSQNHGFNINGSNLTFRHKFKKLNRTISLDLNGTANVNNGDGYNHSINRFYKLGRTDSLNQYYNDSLHSYNLSPTISYTEPIGKRQSIELNYNHTFNRSTSINNTYDFVDSSHGYARFDSLFSNSYKFTSNSDRYTLNYRLQGEKLNLNIGSGVQFLNFNSHNTTKDITVAHNYVNITPTFILRYSFSKTERFQLFYNGRTGTPTASQLQPLTTTTDSINYVVGNPNLKPQYTHSIRMLYSNYNPTTQRVIFATINASAIVNDIQSAIVYHPNGGQTSTFVNLNGTYNLGGFFNYGIVLKKPKSNLNFITNVNYAQSQTLVYDSVAADYSHVYSKNTGLGETVSFTTNIKKNFDMNFSYGATYNIGRNTLNSRENLDYLTQKFSAEITAYTNSGWLIATTFDYTNTNNHTAGYNASVPLLSPSIAKSLFKKKNGEIRLTAFDLLNSNTYVNKVISQTGYSVSRTNTLSRYLMLTFTWNLNNFAGSQQNKMPGMFNNFRRGGGGGGQGGGGGNPFGKP